MVHIDCVVVQSGLDNILQAHSFHTLESTLRPTLKADVVDWQRKENN